MKLHVIARNDDGSRIQSQGNTSARHAITVFHRENNGVQYCNNALLRTLFFLTTGGKEERKC